MSVQHECVSMRARACGWADACRGGGGGPLIACVFIACVHIIIERVFLINHQKQQKNTKKITRNNMWRLHMLILDPGLGNGLCTVAPPLPPHSHIFQRIAGVLN